MKKQFEPNPIFLYEIRQAVRNRTLLTFLCLYLVLLVLLCGGILVNEIGRGNSFFDADSLGRRLTTLVLVVMTNASLIVNLLFCVSATVRQGFEDELIYATPIGSL